MIEKRKTCLYCGVEMDSVTAKKKFCSDLHRVYYNREKARGTLNLDITIKNSVPVVVPRTRDTVLPTVAELKEVISVVLPNGLGEKTNKTKIAEYEAELKSLGNSSVAHIRKKFILKQIQSLNKQ